MAEALHYWMAGTALAIGLSACATPAARLADGLVAFGVPRGPARCVADNMTERLSGAQVRAVADALDQARRGDRLAVVASPRGDGRDGERLGRLMGQAFDLVAKAGDPQIVAVAARAGVACALLGS